MEVLLPLVFGVGVVVVLVVGFLLERKRRERLMLFGLRRGWSYVGEDPSLVDRWPGQPFGHGDHRRARNVMTGTESGRGFTAFDYSWQTHSTDSKGHRSSTTHHAWVVALPMPGWLGTVQVEHQNVLHRVAGAVGLMTDIDLESEEFNRRFRVTATSPKLASDLLPPRTMEHLVRSGSEAWRTCGTELVGWADGHLDPAELVRTCSVLGRVLDGVPAFVWKDAAGPGFGYSPGP